MLGGMHRSLEIHNCLEMGLFLQTPQSPEGELQLEGGLGDFPESLGVW